MCEDIHRIAAMISTLKRMSVIMDKRTGQPYEVNGQTYTATAELKLPYETKDLQRDGTIDLTFKDIDTAGLEGNDLVVFEECYVITEKGEVKIAEHKLLDFDGQTMHFPKIRTTIKDENTETNMSSNLMPTKLIDTVHYENLHGGEGDDPHLVRGRRPVPGEEVLFPGLRRPEPAPVHRNGGGGQDRRSDHGPGGDPLPHLRWLPQRAVDCAEEGLIVHNFS